MDSETTAPLDDAKTQPTTEPDGYYGDAEDDSEVDLSFLDDDKA